MKKKLMILLSLLIVTSSITGCGSNKNDSEPASSAASGDEPISIRDDDDDEPVQNATIEIEVKDYGTIKADLDAESAPITVKNFLDLVDMGFYNGLTFHRIISGFVIQGGDPTGTGSGGSDETIKGEFASNGVDNQLSHTRGALSMARSSDPDSATSQFFIVHQDSTHLDGEYAVFGYVTEGMEIVDQICEDVKTQDDNGTVDHDDQPKIDSIKVVE